jgi:hypothetical protein
LFFFSTERKREEDLLIFLFFSSGRFKPLDRASEFRGDIITLFFFLSLLLRFSNTKIS